MDPRVGGKPTQCLEGIVREWTSFEDLFFKRAYFLAEVQLDPVLMSLIHLDESLEEKYLPNGTTILFDSGAVRRRIMSAGREVKTRFKAMRKKKGFDPLLFMLKNKLPLDKISGTFPVIFRDYRRLSHSLRMAWAFYLTMRMKKLDKHAFSQRSKGGTFCLRRKNLLLYFSSTFIRV